MILFAAALLFAEPAKMPVTIKSFTVTSPVTGGDIAHATVELESAGPRTGTIDVYFNTSNREVTVVPVALPIPIGKPATINIGTASVSEDAEATITASIGNLSKSAGLRLVPARLTMLTCESPNVVPAKSTKCTVGLNGFTPHPVVVALKSSIPAAATVPDTVTIQGNNYNTKTAAFEVKAQPLAQSAAVKISANYKLWTLDFPITVQPVAIESLSIVPDKAMGGCCGDVPKLHVKLTAPAGPDGITIKLAAKLTAYHEGAYMPIRLPDSLVVKNNDHVDQFIDTISVASQTTATVTASSSFFKDADVKYANVTIVPATLRFVGFAHPSYSNVPLGGVNSMAGVGLNGFAPHEGGATVELHYSGDTAVTGPAKMTIPKDGSGAEFPINISPCSVQQTCTVTITARYLGTEVKANATVTH